MKSVFDFPQNKIHKKFNPSHCDTGGREIVKTFIRPFETSQRDFYFNPSRPNPEQSKKIKLNVY